MSLIFYADCTMVFGNIMCHANIFIFFNLIVSLTSTILFVQTANDTDQSTSRGEEQHEETEQEYHSAGFKPCYACGSFRTILFLCGLLVV